MLYSVLSFVFFFLTMIITTNAKEKTNDYRKRKRLVLFCRFTGAFFFINVLVTFFCYMEQYNNLISYFIISSVSIPVIGFILSYLFTINTSSKMYIIKDELKDKFIEHYTDGDGYQHESYYLYFKDLFKQYNHCVEVNQIEYKKINIGDTCYITKNYDCESIYLLDEKPEFEATLCTLEEYANFNKLKRFIPPQVRDKTIGYKQILIDNNNIKEFFRRLILLILGIGMIAYGVCFLIKAFNFLGIFMFLFLSFFGGVTLYMYYSYRKMRIKHNSKLSTKVYKVSKINENIPYYLINKKVKLEFYDLNEPYYGDIKEFSDILVDDLVFLVYVDDEKNPRIGYSKKHTNINL